VAAYSRGRETAWQHSYGQAVHHQLHTLSQECRNRAASARLHCFEREFCVSSRRRQTGFDRSKEKANRSVSGQ
jgi:hypothetical protein